MADLLIRNGRVVMPDATISADIAVEEGKILALGAWGSLGRANREIDATGKLVMPGLVDPHVHIAHPFRGVSQDDFFTATVAAARGGTTTVIDFAIQWDKGLSLPDCIRLRRNQADDQVAVDYGLHACPTLSTAETIEAVPAVIGAGIPSFKIYMIYRKQGRMVDDAILFGMLGEVTKHRGILGVHAENSAIAEFNEEMFLRRGLREAENFPLVKPNMVEAECINRALYLNHWARGRLYIFHLSTAEGLDMIRLERGKGCAVYAETCTHYLALTQDVYRRDDGARFICSPPLRRESDVEALWKGIAEGTISTVGSDHCGFGSNLKDSGDGDFSRTPHGLPGIEARLPIVYTEGVLKGRISLNRMVEVLSANPAKIFGLYPRKGCLLPGSDADVVIVDVDRETVLTVDELHGTVDWTPYDGMRVRGVAWATILRGKVILEGGNFQGQKGEGRFLERRLEKI